MLKIICLTIFALNFLPISVVAAHLKKKPLLQQVHKAQQKTGKEQLRRSRSAEAGLDSSVAVIDKSINYTWGLTYKNDETKFLSETIIHENEVTTKEWLVLVNIHGPAPLNTTAAYIPDTRSLAWATPLLWAQNVLTHISSSHDQLALLQSWSKGRLRKYVTFLLIPPHTPVSFMIGIASVQKGEDAKAYAPDEVRHGGGIQMRLKELPARSIAITVPLLPQGKSTMQQIKHRKKINLIRLFKKALNLAHAQAGIFVPPFNELQKNFETHNVFFKNRHLLAESDHRRLLAEGNADSKIHWSKEFIHTFFGEARTVRQPRATA